jgi:hypothetical protein
MHDRCTTAECIGLLRRMVGCPLALAVEVDLALSRLPNGDELVFQSKPGEQLTAPTVCQYREGRRSLLRTFGYAEVVALEEVDALYESERGVPAPVE